MTKTPPTERQLEVLQWIADGCPDGVMTDTTYKVTAYSLERRSLVKVKRRRPWDAKITEAGRKLLPGAKADTGKLAPVTTQHAEPDTSSQSRNVSKPPAAATKAPPKPKPKSATELMMEKLNADGVIEFDDSETGRYRQLVNIARRKKLFADDMELVVDTHWNKPCTVKLQRRPEWQLIELDPIDVPATLRASHMAVAKLKEQRTNRLGMDTPRWNWTLRVVQALALESEKRGYKIAATQAPRADGYRHYQDEPSKGHIKISIGEDDVELYFRQVLKTVPKVLTPSELRRQEKGYRVTTEESVTTDWIAIKLHGLDPEFWKSEWVETDTLRADEFLPRLLQEIELRANRAVERRDAKRLKEEEKQRQWEIVHDQAVAQLNEKHRAEVLYDQAERYQRAELLADYIAAMKVKARTMNPTDAEAAEKWIYWAESHMLSINPLRNELRMPSNPKPDADAIKPFMQGWNPYGPTRSYY